MIRDIFKNLGSNNHANESMNSTIRILGDRSSGKTTYLAALARWPNSNQQTLVQTVIANNEDAERLVQRARDILEQGFELEPTRISVSVDTLESYSLTIKLSREISWTNIKSKEIIVVSREYGGEFIDDILKSGLSGTNEKLNDYIQDCSFGNGILFLLDGGGYRRDPQCSQALEVLLKKLDDYDKKETEIRRFALTINKCEIEEFWVNRRKTESILKSRFPQTLSVLKRWQASEGGVVDFFSVSSFGMLGTNYPRPNYTIVERGKYGTKAVLKNPQFWKPFGLVAPLYWLSCGKRHPKLEEE